MSWHEDSRTYLPGVQCLAFDAYQDLLWTGTSSGHVSSYFTKREYNYGRYTAYRGHPVGGATREVLVDDRGVLSVGGTIKLANRRGLALWNLRSVGCISQGCNRLRIGFELTWPVPFLPDAITSWLLL